MELTPQNLMINYRIKALITNIMVIKAFIIVKNIEGFDMTRKIT